MSSTYVIYMQSNHLAHPRPPRHWSGDAGDVAAADPSAHPPVHSCWAQLACKKHVREYTQQSYAPQLTAVPMQRVTRLMT